MISLLRKVDLQPAANDLAGRFGLPMQQAVRTIVAGLGRNWVSYSHSPIAPVC